MHAGSCMHVRRGELVATLGELAIASLLTRFHFPNSHCLPIQEARGGKARARVAGRIQLVRTRQCSPKDFYIAVGPAGPQFTFLDA